MYEFDRRTFLKLMGQGTAALGMGFSLSAGGACAREEPSTTAVSESEDTSGKYQIFQPGEYLDWEKAMVEKRLAAVENPPKSQDPPIVVKEDDLLEYNQRWEPYNPLFKDKEYAQKAGYPAIPARPCFQHPSTAINAVAVDSNTALSIADSWYNGHGPNDVEHFVPIYPGDTLTSETEKVMIEDITIPGSDLRHFKTGCIMRLYNQRGDLVVRHTQWRREAYQKIIDGSPPQPYSEIATEWMEDFPPAHYTTDEEWEYIKELWDKEYIRGKDTLYWEDVNIGDEPPWTCSGPITYMDLVGWHGGSRQDLREQIKQGAQSLFRDQYGQYLGTIARHYGGMNIPGARAIFYNNDGAQEITRMVTNYVGDAGFVTRIGWMFQQMYKKMQYPREGGEYLDKVPHMKGRGCEVHGMEADTCIAKGYVTDKYINDRGEHIIELVCWGETLDNTVIQIVPAAAKLPSRQG